MSKDESAKKFNQALDNACGELNEAARISPELFEGDELKVVRREIARLMEQVESRLLPVLRQRYPGAQEG